MRGLRDRVISKYGGMCVCCGETIRLFLSMDHVNNDGNVERKKGIGQQKLYKLLDRLPPQKSYQVLCNNCNLGKHLNGGMCPHETVLRLVISNAS